MRGKFSLLIHQVNFKYRIYFNGSSTINIGWPISGSVSFSSQDPIKIYDSTADLANDRHHFYVKDNKWYSNQMRPGDAWVANLGYHVPASSNWHEFGNRISHRKDGVWQGASPSSYSNISKKYYRTSGTTWVYWRLYR